LTCDAEMMNFESPAAACGTTIFWKQVGHSRWLPLALESAVMCCPHTGHANLNSLIRFGPTIPYPAPAHKPFFYGQKRGRPRPQQRTEALACSNFLRLTIALQPWCCLKRSDSFAFR